MSSPRVCSIVSCAYAEGQPGVRGVSRLRGNLAELVCHVVKLHGMYRGRSEKISDKYLMFGCQGDADEKKNDAHLGS